MLDSSGTQTKFQCNWCNRTFFSKFVLHKHTVQTHDDMILIDEYDPAVTYSVAGKDVKVDELPVLSKQPKQTKASVTKVVPAKKADPLVESVEAKLEQLFKHDDKKTTTDVEKVRLTCKICSKTFFSMRNLQNHRKQEHNLSDVIETPTQVPSDDPAPNVLKNLGLQSTDKSETKVQVAAKVNEEPLKTNKLKKRRVTRGKKRFLYVSLFNQRRVTNIVRSPHVFLRKLLHNVRRSERAQLMNVDVERVSVTTKLPMFTKKGLRRGYLKISLDDLQNLRQRLLTANDHDNMGI